MSQNDGSYADQHNSKSNRNIPFKFSSIKLRAPTEVHVIIEFYK